MHYARGLEGAGCFFRCRHQGFIAGKRGGQLRYLPVLVAERGHIDIVVHDVRAHHHVAHLQTAADAARAARVNHHIGREMFFQQRGGDGRIHFADAALAQGNVFAGKLPRVHNKIFAEAVDFQAVQAVAQQGDFGFHSTDDADALPVFRRWIHAKISSHWLRLSSR